MTGPVPINSCGDVFSGTHAWFPRGQVEEQRMQKGGERHLSSRRIPQPEVAAQMHW